MDGQMIAAVDFKKLFFSVLKGLRELVQQKDFG